MGKARREKKGSWDQGEGKGHEVKARAKEHIGTEVRAWREVKKGGAKGLGKGVEVEKGAQG